MCLGCAWGVLGVCLGCAWGALGLDFEVRCAWGVLGVCLGLESAKMVNLFFALRAISAV